MDRGRRPTPWVIWLGVAVEGGLLLLAWGLGWLWDQPPVERIHWRPRDAALGVAATGPMLILFLVCVRWPVGPLKEIKQFSDAVLRPLFADCTVPELAGLALLAGFGEEMLFRGVLQGAFAERFGPAGGNVAASVLFGLLHFVTPTYALLAGGLSLYLGAWWLATDNLLVVILAHGLYDFLALLYLRRPGESPGGTVDDSP